MNMDRVKFDAFLKTYSFEKYADIVSKEKHAYFDNKQDKNANSGYVYIWVEKEKSKYTIVYVGKAGKTMRKRCNEQVAGFRGGSKIGKIHSQKILKGIESGKRYEVYARKSKVGTIVGESEISFCNVEEIAFIKKLNKFNPLWNSIKT